MSIQLKPAAPQTAAAIVQPPPAPPASQAGPWDEGNSLNTGDTIEYGLSYEVILPDKTTLWIKFHNSTTVRATETGQQASDRLVAFVHAQMTNRLREAVGHNQSMTLD